MINLRLCNAATIRYSLLKFPHMYLCGKGYKYFSPHCCKCNSFGSIVAIRCGYACHGPHSDSVYSGSEHRQFNSPSSVKRASPTHDGRWLAQPNYDALMTHHTTDNMGFITYDINLGVFILDFQKNIIIMIFVKNRDTYWNKMGIFHYSHIWNSPQYAFWKYC